MTGEARILPSHLPHKVARLQSRVFGGTTGERAWDLALDQVVPPERGTGLGPLSVDKCQAGWETPPTRGPPSMSTN